MDPNRKGGEYSHQGECGAFFPRYSTISPNCLKIDL